MRQGREPAERRIPHRDAHDRQPRRADRHEEHRLQGDSSSALQGLGGRRRFHRETAAGQSTVRQEDTGESDNRDEGGTGRERERRHGADSRLESATRARLQIGYVLAKKLSVL